MNNTITEKLLDCPFCGSTAEWGKGQHGDGTEWHHISCSECECIAPYSKTKEGYVKLWNSRVSTKAMLGIDPKGEE